MTDQIHKLLVVGIVASVSFTVYIAGLLFGTLTELQGDVKGLLEDVGYIKGVLDGR